MLLRNRSGIDVIALNDGHKKIKMTSPMNFSVKVKYFSFSYEKGASQLNFNFLMGKENTYPNKKEVMIEPPVMDCTPK